MRRREIVASSNPQREPVVGGNRQGSGGNTSRSGGLKQEGVGFDGCARYSAGVCLYSMRLPLREGGEQRWYRVYFTPSAPQEQGAFLLPVAILKNQKRRYHQMKVYDELVARGLIAQVTNEEEIREMIDNGKATFYIGFDPTADSLHVGHFMALCLMKRLQMAGNRPIALIGGGTAMIGDPSGRTDMRSMMTQETIQHNCDCFKKQMERFIEFGEGKAQMVNNADWLLKLNYVDFIREIGACFSVNSITCCGPSASSSVWRRA